MLVEEMICIDRIDMPTFGRYRNNNSCAGHVDLASVTVYGMPNVVRVVSPASRAWVN